MACRSLVSRLDVNLLYYTIIRICEPNSTRPTLLTDGHNVLLRTEE